MQKPYGATLKYFFIIILWLLNTEITRDHSWSLVVIRGHSCVLLDKIVKEFLNAKFKRINTCCLLTKYKVQYINIW
jgi:hypothetical protein